MSDKHLRSKDYAVAIRWSSFKGKSYLINQRYKRPSNDALFYTDDRINWKTAVEKIGPEVTAEYIPDQGLQMKPYITKALTVCTPREERVLRMRFGLGLDRSYTLDEIGLVFNVTRERIRQLEMRAIRKMRRILNVLAKKGV